MTDQFLKELENRITNINGYFKSTEWFEFSQTETSKELVLELIKELQSERSKRFKLLITLEYYSNDSIFDGKIKRLDGKPHSIEANKAIMENSK